MQEGRVTGYFWRLHAGMPAFAYGIKNVASQRGGQGFRGGGWLRWDVHVFSSLMSLFATPCQSRSQLQNMLTMHASIKQLTSADKRQQAFLCCMYTDKAMNQIRCCARGHAHINLPDQLWSLRPIGVDLKLTIIKGKMIDKHGVDRSPHEAQRPWNLFGLQCVHPGMESS